MLIQESIIMSYNGNKYVSSILKSEKRSFYTYISSDNKCLDSVTSTFTYVKNPTSDMFKLIEQYHNTENYEYKNSIWNIDLTYKTSDILNLFFPINKLTFIEKLLKNTEFGYKTYINEHDGKEYFKIIFSLCDYYSIKTKYLLFNPIISNIKQFIRDVKPCLLVITVPNIGKNNSLLTCLNKILEKNANNSNTIVYIKN